MLEITCKVVFLSFESSFGTFLHKVVQTWFILHELDTQHYLHKNLNTSLSDIYYCVLIVRTE